MGERLLCQEDVVFLAFIPLAASEVRPLEMDTVVALCKTVDRRLFRILPATVVQQISIAVPDNRMVETERTLPRRIVAQHHLSRFRSM